MLRINDMKKVLNEFLKYIDNPKFVEYLNNEDIINTIEDFCAGISTEMISFKLKQKKEQNGYQDNG
jgi:hypothetical protein